MSEIDLTVCGNLMSELRNFAFGAPLSVRVNGKPVTVGKFEKNDQTCTLELETVLEASSGATTHSDVPEASNGQPE